MRSFFTSFRHRSTLLAAAAAAAAALLHPVPVRAQDMAASEAFDPETGTLYYADGSGRMELPSGIDGAAVLSLGEGFLADRIDITSVVLPDTVQVMKESVFSECEALAELTLPDSLVIIDNYSLYNCVELTSLRIPPSVSYIGSLALSYMDGLESLTFTGEVPAFGAWALSYLPDSCSIYVPADRLEAYQAALPDYTVISSGEPCLPGVSFAPETDFDIDAGGSLTACRYTGPYLRIPAQINGIAVTSVGESILAGNTTAWRIDLPDGVTSIGAGAFSDMEHLRSVSCPDTVGIIGPSAFRGYGGTVFSWPAGLTSIGSYAFYGSALTDTLALPEGLLTIDESAFAGCPNLSAVRFPSTLVTIGPKAFAGTSFITELSFAARSLPAIGDDAFTSFRAALTKVVIPSDASEEDQATVSEYFRSIGASRCRVVMAPFIPGA